MDTPKQLTILQSKRCPPLPSVPSMHSVVDAFITTYGRHENWFYDDCCGDVLNKMSCLDDFLQEKRE
jgi:hypothetical protein